MAVHQRHAFAETRGFRRRGDAGGTAPDHQQVVSFQIVRHYVTLEQAAVLDLSEAQKLASMRLPSRECISSCRRNIEILTKTLRTNIFRISEWLGIAKPQGTFGKREAADT